MFLDNVSAIQQLKASGDADIKVWGSSELVHLLLQHDLVDELWLMIHPVLLGEGKRLFDETSAPAAYTLTEHHVTNTGVIMAHYHRAGEVKTGNAGPDL